MIAGVDYDTAHAQALKRGLKKADGSYFTSHADLTRLLKDFGVSCVRRRFRSLRETPTPSIVKVNPTKDGKYWHWVVLVSRGGEHVLLDPNPDRAGRIEDFRGYRGAGVYLHAA
ncbi:hypothetical protein [Frateuria sp.]